MLVMPLLTGSAAAFEPGSIPPDERPELIFRQLFDQQQRPPLAPLHRKLTPADYLPKASAASSYITIENNPVNTDLAPIPAHIRPIRIR